MDPSSRGEMRADLALVAAGLVVSRNRAQELIASGRVYLLTSTGRVPIQKSSQKVAVGDRFEVAPSDQDYVSRGGVKLSGALERVGHSVINSAVMDIGISMGGFTDCLLKRGAARVVGLDVGHGQLAPSLRSDSRVKLIEGVNARDLRSEDRRREVLGANGGAKFDLIVIDVSFISLTLVLPETIQYLKESAAVLALVKPQFEVGREGLGKNGVVKDPGLYSQVEEKLRRAAETCGLMVEDYFASSIQGSDGNHEFFIFAQPAQLQLG